MHFLWGSIQSVCPAARAGRGRQGLKPLDVYEYCVDHGGSSMQAMTRSVPPQSGQASMSIAKTQLRRCIDGLDAWFIGSS